MKEGRPFVDVFRIEGFRSALSIRGRRLEFKVPGGGSASVTGLLSVSAGSGGEFDVGAETVQGTVITILRDDWQFSGWGEPTPGWVFFDPNTDTSYRVTGVPQSRGDIALRLECDSSSP